MSCSRVTSQMLNQDKKPGDLFLLPTGDGRMLILGKIDGEKCYICGQICKPGQLLAHQKIHGSTLVNISNSRPSSQSQVVAPGSRMLTSTAPTVPLVSSPATVTASFGSQTATAPIVSSQGVSAGNQTPSYKIILKGGQQTSVPIVYSSLNNKAAEVLKNTNMKPTVISTHPISVFDKEKDSEIKITDPLTLNPQTIALNPFSIFVNESFNQYQCSICQQVFNSKKHLKEHSEDHFAVRPFKCNVCNKAFRRSSALTAHKQTHLEKEFGDYSVTCSTCNKQFYTQRELDIHCNKEHSNCDVCRKSFPSRIRLMRHKQACHEKKISKCEFCSKLFISRSFYLNHMRSHTDEPPLACELCGKSFKSSERLKKHRHTHVEKPYECSVCGKAFSKIGHLQMHNKFNHTGEKASH